MILMCDLYFFPRLMSCDCELDECIQEGIVWHSSRFPELRIHAVARKSWDRIYLIHKDFPIFLQKDIDSTHTLTFEDSIGLYRDRSHSFLCRFVELRRDDDLCLLVARVFLMV